MHVPQAASGDTTPSQLSTRREPTKRPYSAGDTPEGHRNSHEGQPFSGMSAGSTPTGATLSARCPSGEWDQTRVPTSADGAMSDSPRWSKAMREWQHDSDLNVN